jgi:uncharacterized repeat protein (TIGR03803 family)
MFGSRVILGACTCIAIVIGKEGCEAAPPKAATYETLYAFGDGTDGAFPYGNPVEANGMLYGTTYEGGLTNGCCGTIFALNLKSGAESTVYQFQGGNDGASPPAGLIYTNGLLYGTTQYGGGGNPANCLAAGCGTVFSVNPSTGVEKVLYAFQGGNDGSEPFAGLVYAGGKLWGTTAYGGGDASNGTVFTVDPTSGAETVAHAFQGGPGDGSYPISGLLNVNGIIYGTTEGGGTYEVGTVFSLNEKNNAEAVVYAFNPSTGLHDGWAPYAGLVNSGTTLYGTTSAGGSIGQGTVFSVDLDSGKENVLYSFGKRGNGFRPESGLVIVKGDLYGTTYGGGSSGFGTVFSLTPTSGKERVVYSFSPDNGGGAYSDSGLSLIANKLYGVTVQGGDPACSCGVIFSLKP